MYPPEFEYERPGSVDEAIELLAANAGRDVELLAGGHSLLPTLKSGLASPDLLIDIGGIDELRGIEPNGDSTAVGALTSYADIESNDHLWEVSTVTAEAASHIGDLQVRNAGTIGGNIAHADPASDMPAGVLAADAVIHSRGPDGDGAIPAADFFEGMYGTALADDEILTGIEFPHQAGGAASAYVKKPSPSSGYAIVGVAASVETNGGSVDSARVAINGAVDHAVRLSSVEEALIGESLTEDVIQDASSLASDDLQGMTLMGDGQASEQFRAKLAEIYCSRALEKVADRL